MSDLMTEIEQVKKDLEFYESKGYYPKRLASSLTNTLYSLIATIESQQKKITKLNKECDMQVDCSYSYFSQLESQKEEIDRLLKVEADYKALQQIMDRARKLAFQSQQEEEDRPRFKMDAEGNLSRL